MKKLFIAEIAIVFMMIVNFNTRTIAQEGDESEKSELKTKQLQEESSDLNKQILSINKKIAGVISGNELLSSKVKLKLLPYQVALNRGDNFITLEKHKFIKSIDDTSKIVGIMKKRMTVYMSGSSASKIESEIIELRYDDESLTIVKMTDPSPDSADSDDMRFEYTRNSRVLKNILLKDIQNTTAFPIANELKRSFIMPHLLYFYSVVLDVAETYKKGHKDSESLMADFLLNSTNY